MGGMLVGNGGLGVDSKSGKLGGSLGGGLDYLAYKGKPDSSKHGNHVGVLTAYRAPFGGDEDDASVLVVLRYGHLWVLGISSRDEQVETYATALSLDLLGGFAITRRSAGVTIGLGVSLRCDYFSAWHFKL
jgi:hypothetical protein